MSQTSLYRTTKTRNARSQEQLKSSLLVHKQSTSKKAQIPLYHQTYGILLPEPSVQILTPIISALTGTKPVIKRENRSLYTIGIWIEDTSTIYRCCFVQPEIASANCSIPLGWKSTAEDAINSLSEIFPNIIPCSMSTKKNKLPQILGRMTPYVANMLPFKVTLSFANISGSYFLFVRTDDSQGQIILTLSRNAVAVLQPYFPSYSACVFDVNTNSYKITAVPDTVKNMNEPNKNTCMYIYGDGSFRLQGIPTAMIRVCESFKDALHTIARSSSWNSFTSKLVPIPDS